MILLITSGATFGFSRTIPHILGVVVGVGIIGIFTGLGIGVLLTKYPDLRFGMTLISAGWILYLAWKLWNLEKAVSSALAKPFSFPQAVMFQWINPKIWSVAILGMAQTDTTLPYQLAFELGHALSGINFFVCLFWTFVGQSISALLDQPGIWRWFMRAMALALASTVIFLFI